MQGISLHMNLLPQQNNRKPALTEKQEAFLDALFDNGGNLTAAAQVAGYSEGSIAWLRDRLADEIIERTKTVLAGQSLKAANKLVSLVDAVDIERGDDLRMKAAESILNRVGLGKQETMNHNVSAVHGVVLLPPKKEVVIDG
jgi:phage terminase small subunit